MSTRPPPKLPHSFRFAAFLVGDCRTLAVKRKSGSGSGTLDCRKLLSALKQPIEKVSWRHLSKPGQESLFKIMKKIVAVLAALFAACVTPVFAQISWAPPTAINSSLPPGTPLPDAIWCVTYANGTFAAVTDQGNLITSTDGLNWNVQSITTTGLFSIAYGNGTWVAVGANGMIFVSTNLNTWLTAQPTTNQLNGVAYAGGVWCIVGNNATVITSPDAVNWTIQGVPPGVTGFLHGISYSEGGFDGTGFIVCGAQSGNGSVSGPGVVLFMPISGGTIGQITRSSFMGGQTTGNLEAIFSITAPTYPHEYVFTTVVAVGWGIIASETDNIGGTSSGYSSVPDVVYRGLASSDTTQPRQRLGNPAYARAGGLHGADNFRRWQRGHSPLRGIY
jgi:hypothetical protein